MSATFTGCPISIFVNCNNPLKHFAHIWTHPGMQGNFCAAIVWLRPYIRLLVEDSVASEPCWIFARFPSFSMRRPCRRVGGIRVWGSWSNLFCHHGITYAILGEPRALLLLLCCLLYSPLSLWCAMPPGGRPPRWRVRPRECVHSYWPGPPQRPACRAVRGAVGARHSGYPFSRRHGG